MHWHMDKVGLMGVVRLKLSIVKGVVAEIVGGWLVWHGCVSSSSGEINFGADRSNWSLLK